MLVATILNVEGNEMPGHGMWVISDVTVKSKKAVKTKQRLKVSTGKQAEYWQACLDIPINLKVSPCFLQQFPKGKQSNCCKYSLSSKVSVEISRKNTTQNS